MRDVVRLPIAGQLREHISYSEIRLFGECEWRWYLDQVMGMKVPERSLHLAFGSAIHRAMELAFSQDRPPLGDVDAVLLSELDRELEGLELQKHELEERERLRWLAPTIVRDALACPDLQGIIPLKSELGLMVPIDRTDGLDVKFKGFVDFIYVKQLARKRVIYIADFKTCTWGWSYEKLTDPLVCAQILLYKHFFCKMTGAEPRDVSAAFILLKKSPPAGRPTVEVAKIGAGPKVLSQAIELLQGSISRMQSGTYRQNREACQRFWTDPVTKEERSWQCRHYGTPDCPAST